MCCSGKAVNLGQIKILKATLGDLKGSPDYPATIVAHMISSVPLQAGARTFANHYGILSQLVSDGPNWVFRYGQMVQLGIEIRAESATIQGEATIHRRCRTCSSMFDPTDNELHCANCTETSAA